MKKIELIWVISKRKTQSKRILVTIAGAPVSSKSTVADALACEFGEAAAIVPMDRFHPDNEVLKKRGLLSRKGAPEAFNSNGFIIIFQTLKPRMKKVKWLYQYLTVIEVPPKKAPGSLSRTMKSFW